MKSNNSTGASKKIAVFVGVFLALGLGAIGVQTGFFQTVVQLLPNATSEREPEHSEAEEHDGHEHSEVDEHDGHEHSEAEEHDGHEHSEAEEHDGHEHTEAEEHDEHERSQTNAPKTLTLDDAALFNIGVGKNDELTLEARDYLKTFRLPGVVREIPGRSNVGVVATVSGIVSKIEANEGDALCPGEPLMEIRLTGDEAIQRQTELLALLQERDALQLEEERLGSLAEGIAPKQQRELFLKKTANDAAIQSQRSVVKLCGFTDAEIDETLVGKRQAITSLIIRVPLIDEVAIEPQTRELHIGVDLNDHFLILETTSINKGDSVQTGDVLARISDLRTLQIEGKAFASDENIVNDALLNRSPISATFPDALRRDATETIENLRLKRVDDRVDSANRSLGCWIDLPNVRLGETSETPDSTTATSEGAAKTVRWRFKPGQRCELGVGYETIENCFVLPPDAVAFDRNFAFVFELTETLENKRVWMERPVRVLHRAGDAIVVAVDETIQPGMKIAKAGAEQMHIALGSGSAKLQSSHNHNH